MHSSLSGPLNRGAQRCDLRHWNVAKTAAYLRIKVAVLFVVFFQAEEALSSLECTINHCLVAHSVKPECQAPAAPVAVSCCNMTHSHLILRVERDNGRATSRDRGVPEECCD